MRSLIGATLAGLVVGLTGGTGMVVLREPPAPAPARAVPVQSWSAPAQPAAADSLASVEPDGEPADSAGSPVEEPPAAPAPRPGAGPLAAAPAPDRRLARIYGSMSPRQAAEILGRMRDPEVAGILAQLRERQVADILAQLPPERAAALSRLAVDHAGPEPAARP